ncbi:MAG: hypothetical protein WBO45_23485, partial [Planctomycetota bacterium]
ERRSLLVTQFDRRGYSHRFASKDYRTRGAQHNYRQFRRTTLASGLPVLGNQAFALDLVRAPANALVAIAGADAPAALPLSGCTLLVAPGQATVALTASPLGTAQVPLPVPTTATLLGVSFYFQGAALSSTASNGFVLSAGLRVDLGQ